MFFNKTPNAVKLSQEAASILDVFTRTQERLEENNQLIDNENHTLDEQIKTLTAQKALLDETKVRNEKILGNIQKILE